MGVLNITPDSFSDGGKYQSLDHALSACEKMIDEGYAWAYDGGTKQKDFEELREIRRSFGTLLEG